jgi:hypothetical protein
MNNDKITKEQAKDALLRSGYLIESRMETFLRDRKYSVETNVVVPDLLTGKSRELDLNAVKTDSVSIGRSVFVSVCLLIECENNPQPIVFITKEHPRAQVHHFQVKLSGLPTWIPVELAGYEGPIKEYLPDFLRMNEYHHYCNMRIATQFCSFTKKKDSKEKEGWMAKHMDEHFGSFSKLSMAVDHIAGEFYKSGWNVREPTPVIVFYYPIVVVQGELLEARTHKRSFSLFKSNFIQYRHSTIEEGKEKEYHIDITTERYLPKYLNIVEAELQETKRRLRQKGTKIREAAEYLIRKMRQAKTEQDVRKLLEF